jgi:hypothetical protein
VNSLFYNDRVHVCFPPVIHSPVTPINLHPQVNRTLERITINSELSLVEFRDEKTQELDLSGKEYGAEEAIIIGALLQVTFSNSVLCLLLLDSDENTRAFCGCLN